MNLQKATCTLYAVHTKLFAWNYLLTITIDFRSMKSTIVYQLLSQLERSHVTYRSAHEIITITF